MKQNEVNSAFEILLEEIEEVFNYINNDIETAIKNKEYEEARDLTQWGDKLKTFREKVKSLQLEWQNLFSIKIKPKTAKRKIKSKLKKGLRTPESEFKIPILKTLVDLGGKGKVKDVINSVYQMMKSKLNHYDLQPLPSNPKEKRWENTVQWARNTMVKEGLLAKNSQQGIWQITEKGREYLRSEIKIE
ncbi:MAG: winged helix-turn-helix domain-containing protein [Melioribacteraceae bacterium]